MLLWKSSREEKDVGLKLACECGHGKSNHSTSNSNYEIEYVWCNVIGCQCKKYKFSKRVTVNRKSQNIEPVIKGRVKRKPYRTGILYMSRLGPDGKPYND